MHYLLKLTYLFLAILTLNVSMASFNSVSACENMSQHSAMTMTESMPMAHIAMQDVQKLNDKSQFNEDCCGDSQCPMTSCSSPLIITLPTLIKPNHSGSHQALDRYSDLPVLSVVTVHYRPPIQLLS